MNYSVLIATQISAYLEKNDWNFDFNEKKGVFRFSLRIHNKLRSIDYIIDVRDDSYIVYASSSISPDADDGKQMAAVSEFICRANFGLLHGCFEFDFTDGEVRYRYTVDCRSTIDDVIIEDSIKIPGIMLKQYGNGLVDVIFDQASPKQAVEASERVNTAVVRSLMSEIMKSDHPDQELMARLSACLENMPEDNSNDDNEDMTIKTDPFSSEGGDES